MRIISRYSTQLKAEAGLRYRGKGEVVPLPSEDYPKHPWALVDKYEPKPFPPRASSGRDKEQLPDLPASRSGSVGVQAGVKVSPAPRPEGVPGVFVCREEDIG